VVAEALGTALLVAGVVGSGIMGERLADGNDAIALLANSTATVFLLYVLMLVLGPISGAHFNPAVTLVATIERFAAPGRAGAFVAAQVLGGILGTLLAHGMFDLPAVTFSSRQRTGLDQWLAEAVATFGLLITILGLRRSQPAVLAAAVAAYIGAAYWFTASTSFANPAVTIARTLSDTFAGISPLDAPAFILAQIAGALAALATWRFLGGRSSAGSDSG
jgi:glycerol uptake facilitator-like aquaporin